MGFDATFTACIGVKIKRQQLIGFIEKTNTIHFHSDCHRYDSQYTYCPDCGRKSNPKLVKKVDKTYFLKGMLHLDFHASLYGKFYHDKFTFVEVDDEDKREYIISLQMIEKDIIGRSIDKGASYMPVPSDADKLELKRHIVNDDIMTAQEFEESFGIYLCGD